MAKKLIMIIMSIIFSLSLIGCNRNIPNLYDDKQSEIDNLKNEINNLKKQLNNQNSGSSSSDGNTSNNQDNSNTSSDDNNKNGNTEQQNSPTNNEQSPINTNSGQNSQNTGISVDKAKEIALSKVPGATDRNVIIKPDIEHDLYIYEVTVIYNGTKHKFEIDAHTGTILEWKQKH